MRFFFKIFEDEQNVWNILLGLLFAALLLGGIVKLRAMGVDPMAITPWQFTILALAVLRLIRLFSYDKITQSGRDLFHDYLRGQDGAITRVRPSKGLRRTLAELLDCPWCTGVWLTLVVVFAYYVSVLARFPIVVLAVAGAGSLLQLLANMVGWTAERQKAKSLRGE